VEQFQIACESVGCKTAMPGAQVMGA
jgi:hypothetical protein